MIPYPKPQPMVMILTPYLTIEQPKNNKTPQIPRLKVLYVKVILNMVFAPMDTSANLPMEFKNSDVRLIKTLTRPSLVTPSSRKLIVNMDLDAILCILNPNPFKKLKLYIITGIFSTKQGSRESADSTFQTLIEISHILIDFIYCCS